MAKIYHDKFSYDLVPDTAINNFRQMNKVTSVNAGNLYVYIFEGEQYQGRCQVLNPGEKALTGNCGSVIISLRPISVEESQKSGCAPAKYWELPGSMYVLHFSSIYKYVS